MSEQPETRAMMASDYPEIYRWVARGATEEMVLQVYPMKAETLRKRMAADRPDLWAKWKKLRTSVRVEADPQKRAAAQMQATAQAFKAQLVALGGHDIGILYDQMMAQIEAKAKDPNKVLTPLVLPHAKSISSLTKAMAMIPEMGLQSGSNTSVTVNTVNHAQTMRRGDNSNILADENELAGAIVDVESEVLE